ncbi:MAG: gamma-glutamyl-gamma-aminobutyrate hydrolase family protein, partial [Myxococcota bacterium]|nr:gamma-glutamyl-gamma-aminobutyrate hydrolase family protein [Myxococcota bacterium]
KQLSGLDGILVPGGFGERGVEGKILSITYARENNIPFFGICLGMQLVVVEFARSILGFPTANSREFDPKASHFLIELMNDQHQVTEKGGTMRLGSYPCQLKKGSLAAKIYGKKEVQERHRHRYEVNPQYFDALEEKGLVVSGKSPDGLLAEMVEYKDHPHFIACQFHPEFKSRLLEPHPLFVKFVAASLRTKTK